MRIRALVVLAAAALGGAALFGQAGRGDWSAYAHNHTGQRFSPLTQIDTTNVSRLRLAWQYGIDPAAAKLNPATQMLPPTEAVPLAVDGVLFVPTTNRAIVALEAHSGREIWKHDLGSARAPTRGVTYWAGDAQNPARILAGTSDGRLLALDARTGAPIPAFGSGGAIDLRAGVADRFPTAPYRMASPGAIFRNLIITGAAGKEGEPGGPDMDVRAWDLRTGKLVWTFHTIPRPDEAHYDTWPKDYWIGAGTPANWGAVTVDEQRGLVFMPVGQPAGDYYGGARPGQNLFSSSIVALDASSGKLRWHFQLTHHDVWDYDISAAPALIDITRDGKRIPVVVAVTKAGYMFFLERETGRSVYPVEERPVPQSDVPGEKTWPTQPFPVRPPALGRVSIGPEEIFTGEPEHEKYCREIVAKIGGIRNYGPYTPYSAQEVRIIFPGQQGGPNFGGVSADPSLGYVFVNVRNLGGLGRLEKTADGDVMPYRRVSPLGRGTMYARFSNTERGLPCQPPPWAELIAVNANTGDFAWRVPLGTMDEMEAKGVRQTGALGQGGSIATASGLVFIAGTIDKRFRAFESRTGKVLWETTLDAEGHTSPMTYMGRDGKQYVAIVSSGVNVFALP
jgi:quinoprotein glucose dehydrogenase